MIATTRAQAIASAILAEALDAAKSDGVSFTDEQIAFIEQALTDAAQEAVNQVLLARALELKHLASALKKILPSALLADIVERLDPMTPFLKVLRDV